MKILKIFVGVYSNELLHCNEIIQKNNLIVFIARHFLENNILVEPQDLGGEVLLDL
jgi:hypothetical protein